MKQRRPAASRNSALLNAGSTFISPLVMWKTPERASKHRGERSRICKGLRTPP